MQPLFDLTELPALPLCNPLFKEKLFFPPHPLLFLFCPKVENENIYWGRGWGWSFISSMIAQRAVNAKFEEFINLQ